MDQARMASEDHLGMGSSRQPYSRGVVVNRGRYSVTVGAPLQRIDGRVALKHDRRARAISAPYLCRAPRLDHDTLAIRAPRGSTPQILMDLEHDRCARAIGVP